MKFKISKIIEIQNDNEPYMLTHLKAYGEYIEISKVSQEYEDDTGKKSYSEIDSVLILISEIPSLIEALKQFQKGGKK